MKHIFSILICCCLPVFLSAQTGTIKVSKPKSLKSQAPIDSLNTSIDNYSKNKHHLFELTTFSYEQKYFFSDLDKQFKTIDNNGKMSLPCNYISMSIIDQFDITRSWYNYPGYFTFSYLIPSTITFNDSIKEKLRGFNLKISFAGQNIIDRNHCAVFFTEGINCGRLKIINEKNEKAKNAIFAPYLGLVVRLTFSRFTLFAVSQVDYDISSSHWKKTWFSKNQENEIPNFKQGGLTFSLGINYSINKIYSR